MSLLVKSYFNSPYKVVELIWIDLPVWSGDILNGYLIGKTNKYELNCLCVNALESER